MKRKVALVGEDSDLREMVEFVLTDADFEVIGYNSAEAFWDGLEMHRPDLILLDVTLPDGRSLDICRELHSARRRPTIPVVVMSAVYDYAGACADAAFLRKPFDIADLISCVRQRIA